MPDKQFSDLRQDFSGPAAAERRAGFARRLAAAGYDLFLLLAVLFLATALALPLNRGQAFSADQWGYPLYLLAVCAGFYVGFWSRGGQTLGMRAWRIKLVGFDGAGVGWRAALLRFAAALLAWGCFGLGVLWCVADRRGLAWHDYLSRTRLILLPAKKSG